MDLSKINSITIRAAYQRMGYKFFNGIYDLNIGGIRCDDSVSNKFDDAIFVVYRDKANEIKCHVYPATTDPGKHWLMNPTNKNGCAILVPGQYRSVYTLGLHGRSGNSPYKALEQVAAMQYVRDNNKDDKLDFDLYRDPNKLSSNAFWDIIKSNLHRASKLKIVQLVELYSAGCQVIQSVKHFDQLIGLCEKQVEHGHGNKFTYTLFEQSQLFV